jgi:hypothetical protein
MPEATPANPYADDGDLGADVTPGRDAAPSDESRSVRSSLMFFGGAYGLYTTLGLAAGLGGGLDGGRMLLVLGGAVAGGAGGYWIGAHKHVDQAQVDTIASSSAWGAGLGLMFAHIADTPDCLTCEDDQPSGDYLLASALTGTVGLGAGIWLARQDPGADDVALVNSLGGYGLLGSLMLGVAMDPPQGRAYSMNAILGTGAGLAAGLYLAHRTDVPRKRMAYLDLGVGAGALAPWLVYGLAGGSDSGSARQWTGVASIGLAVAGGWLTWRWTRDLVAPKRVHAAPDADDSNDSNDSNDPNDSTLDADDLAAVPPALLQRGARGGWRLAPVAPRPFVLEPAAADPRTRLGLGIDLLAGAF